MHKIKNIYNVKVIDQRKNAIIVNGNLKSIYSVPISDFEEYELEDILGKNIDVYISTLDSKSSSVAISYASYKRAKNEIIWHDIVRKYNNKDILSAKITNSTKGGYSVHMDGVSAFLPVSHISVSDGDDLSNKVVDVVIIGLNKLHRNIIVSNREIANIEIQNENKDKLSNLVVGMKLSGIVKGISNNSVFVTIGGDVQGIIPHGEVSYEYNIDLYKSFDVGQKIDVVVKEIKSSTKLILSVIDLLENPFERLSVLDKVSVTPFYLIVDSNKEDTLDDLDKRYTVLCKEKNSGILCKMSSEDSRFSKSEIANMIEEKTTFDCVVKYINIDSNHIIISSNRNNDEKWESFLKRYEKSENGLIDFVVKDKDKGIVYAVNEDFKTIIPFYELDYINMFEAYKNIKSGETITVKALYLNHDKKRIVCSKRMISKSKIIAILNKLMSQNFVMANVVYSNNYHTVIRLDSAIETTIVNNVNSEMIDLFASNKDVKVKVSGYNKSTLVPYIAEYDQAEQQGVARIVDVLDSFDDMIDSLESK